MPPTSTDSRPGPKKIGEPDFWTRYSPHHECLIAFTSAALLEAILLFILGIGVALRVMASGENSKPPQMDIVEIEGGGGGLGGSGVGPGLLDTGNPGLKKEGGENPNPSDLQKIDVKIKDFQFKELPKNDIGMPSQDDLPPAKNDDPFAIIDAARIYGEELLAKELSNPKAKPSDSVGVLKKGDKPGSGGGAGGKQGPGIGKGSGPGQGNSPTGAVLNDQRRRELRWQILASKDGDVHLKKLQALKVTLIVPLMSKPGFSMRFDLSKPTISQEVIRSVDDSNKVRWKNDDAIEMIGLAKALRLPEVPRFAVIYLPSELEKDMARRELAYQGRQEHEIAKTTWDVRQRDGAYENEPTIVEQLLRKGVK